MPHSADRASCSRRSFLTAAGVLGAAGLAPWLAARGAVAGGRRAPRMLVLGGTRFLGPAVVDAAVAAGFEVTLFNRGRSNPELYPELEKLKGDRDLGELDVLRGRAFEVVVDTSGYVPGQVRAAAETVAEHAELYVFVSTVSVYPDQSAAVVGEDTPVSDVTAEFLAEATTIRKAVRQYGPMKARCEQAAEEVMPGRVANVRPGLIVGPADRSDRFTYWPARVARGGEVLAPGDGSAEVQFIDVRDLGRWIVQLGQDRTSGVFNAVGFDGRVSLMELLHGAKIVLGASCSFTWVEEQFLLDREVRPYTQLPLWLPRGQRGHFAVERAFAAGLRCRPIGDTIRDTQAWHAERQDHEWRRAGLRPEREAELLAEWHGR